MEKRNEVAIDWPRKIRILRRCFGLSQGRLGARIGVSEKTVRRWEHGEAVPSRLSLIWIRQKFGKAWKEILERATVVLLVLASSLLIGCGLGEQEHFVVVDISGTSTSVSIYYTQNGYGYHEVDRTPLPWRLDFIGVSGDEMYFGIQNTGTSLMGFSMVLGTIMVDGEIVFFSSCEGKDSSMILEYRIP